MTGPLETNRISPVTTALNERIGDGISGSELKELKKLASNGTVALLDINATMHEVDTNGSLSQAQKDDLNNALTEMRAVAAPVAQAQSDAIGKTLGIIDSLNPFAYARALFGGERVGCGYTW